MNYRILFITAFLILVIGIVGIIYMPSGEPEPQQVAETQQPQASEPAQPAPEPKKSADEKTILIATAQQNLSVGHILQTQDFQLSEQQVAENDPAVANDLSELLKDNTPLQGFTLAQAVAKGAAITPEVAVSPNSDKFLSYTLDPSQEVGYQACIKAQDSDSLATMQAGSDVSVYVFNPNENRQARFAPLFSKVKLLKLVKTPVSEDDKEAPSCVYTAQLKLLLAQVKTLYALKGEPRFLLLPVETELPAQHRGTLIRSLRGN